MSKTRKDEAHPKESESVEGIERPPPSLETYPIDDLLIRSETRAIVDVLRRIKGGFIVLNPDFQRASVWKPDRESRLIESVLMRIPIPVFYFAEDPHGNLVVVDGLQRLNAFKRFHEGQLVLELPKSEVDGKTVYDLPPKLKNRFEDGQLTLYLVDAKVPESVRLDIFERVNSGVPLTRQQMRNALYSGAATKLLRELAVSAEFNAATFGALSDQDHKDRMDDREAVNRWFAFVLLGWKEYPKHRDYDDFLASGLKRLNTLADAERETHASAFRKSMLLNKTVFGKHAFRKHTGESESRRPFNLALFDAFSVLLVPYSADRANRKASQVRRRFYALMRDEEFHESISRGTLSTKHVQTRFRAVENMLAEVLGAP